MWGFAIEYKPGTCCDSVNLLRTASPLFEFYTTKDMKVDWTGHDDDFTRPVDVACFQWTDRWELDGECVWGEALQFP